QYIGSPATSDGPLRLDNTFFGSTNGSPSQFTASQFANTHDALLHYVSKLFDRRLQIDLLVGYHYSEDTITPNSNGGSASVVTDTRVNPLSNFENVSACTPQPIPGTTDPATGMPIMFNPCPVQNYRYGGLGFLQHTIEQRVAAQAAGTYFARLGG